jgi:predicted metal-binding membrane protein
MTQLRAFLDNPRAVALAGLGLAALTAWIALWSLEAGATPNLAALATLCLSPAAAGWGAYPAVAAMWLLMAVAMMLPTAAPAIHIYSGLAAKEWRGGGYARLLAGFVGGYLAMWGGFALAAAAAQIWLAQTGALSAPALTGAILIGAGAYQLSALKAACLTKCRNPMAFFLSHWAEGASGALKMGLRHGLICLGCCWALMLLMFAFGAMNLVWMGLLGLFMLLEKTAPHAALWGRWTGFGLIGSGVAIGGAALL